MHLGHTSLVVASSLQSLQHNNAPTALLLQGVVDPMLGESTQSAYTNVGAPVTASRHRLIQHTSLSHSMICTFPVCALLAGSKRIWQLKVSDHPGRTVSMTKPCDTCESA